MFFLSAIETLRDRRHWDDHPVGADVRVVRGMPPAATVTTQFSQKVSNPAQNRCVSLVSTVALRQCMPLGVAISTDYGESCCSCPYSATVARACLIGPVRGVFEIAAAT